MSEPAENGLKGVFFGPKNDNVTGPLIYRGGGQGQMPYSDLTLIVSQPNLAGTKCSNGSQGNSSCLAGAECSNTGLTEIIPNQALMPPSDRETRATEISGGTEPCLDGLNPGVCRSDASLTENTGIHPNKDIKDIDKDSSGPKIRAITDSNVVVSSRSNMNEILAHKDTYEIRSKENKIDMQSHLPKNLSLARRQDRLKGNKDDIRHELETNDKNKLEKDSNDENDKNDENNDFDDEINNVDDQKSEVSTICEKFGGKKKIVKRHQVKISPKSKFSPYSNVKRVKAIKKLPKNDQEVSLLSKSSEKFKLEKLATNSSKVSSIVAAFEDNIAKQNSTIEIDDKKEKRKVENAFHKLMNAKKIEEKQHPLRDLRKRERDWGQISHMV